MGDVFVSERFASKVSVGQPNDCWEWKAGKSEFGYGHYWLNGATVTAHRLSFEWSRGRKVEPKRQINHLCHNPSCVNPLHLQEGTHKDNMEQMTSAGRAANRLNGKHRFASDPNADQTGENNPSAKLTIEQVREIRRLRQEGWKLVPLAEKFNVTHPCIWHIVKGFSWREET